MVSACPILTAITFGVFALPVPGITHHRVQVMLGLPAKFLLRAGGIGIALGDITSAARGDFYGNGLPRGLFKGRDRLAHRIAPPGAEVPGTAARSQTLKRPDMPAGKVHYMDVIAHAGTIGGGIVITKKRQSLAPAHGHLADIRH